jgi:PST family polysaccharide transporter
LAVWFYKRTELYPICIVMGSFLLVNGFASQPLALLKKRIRQKELSLTQLCGTILAGAAAIGLAWLSSGYWALVAQTLVAVLVTLVFAMLWSGFRPGRPNFAIGSGSLLKFGGLIGICNIITFLQVNLDSILIGHYCTAAELGFYSRAYYLRTLPALYVSMAVTDVMIPAFSALSADKERMAAAFRKVVTLMAFLGFPIAAGMGITAYETVHIVYGSKWTEVATLLQWLTLPAMILPITQAMGWMFISTGRVREMFYLTSATFPAVLLILWYAVATKGVMGIVVAIAILYSLPLPFITIFFALRVASLSLKRTFSPVLKIGIIALLAAAGAWSAGYLAELAAMHWIAVFVCKCLTGAVLYIALSLQLLAPLPVPFLENALGGFRWKV